MKTSNSTSIGLFLIGGILTFIAALLLFSSGSFLGKTHTFVLYFNESVNGLDVGAPVKLKGVRIGQVKKVVVQFDPTNNRVQVPVTIVLEDSYFRTAKKDNPGDEPEIESEEELVKSDFANPSLTESFSRLPLIVGMVGSLQIDSFVTSKLFVNLNYEPTEAQSYLQLDADGIPKIPTKIGNLQNVGDQLVKIADGLSSIDYRGIGNSIKIFTHKLADVNWGGMSDSIRVASSSLSEACQKFGIFSTNSEPILAEFRQACNQFGEASERVAEILRTGTSVPVNLENFLKNASGAARSMKVFLDYLEQNPNALLTGKYVKGHK